MILRALHPEADSAIDVAEPASRERLRDLYRRDAGAPGIRLNLVASIDGSARGDDGTSESLSSRADRAVLGAIRAESDVVLAGASTVRAEGYLMPRTAALAIVTRTGELGDAEVRADVDPGRLLVLGPESARPTAHASLRAPHTFIALPEQADGGVALAAVVESLVARGLPAIVCEGGPSLAAGLLDAGLVGEVCLSTSPRLVGGALPVLGTAARPSVPARLVSLLIDDADGLYARWSIV